jgi:hypothetical protein
VLTAAVFCFSGFSARADCALALPAGGDPEAAARSLALAARSAAVPAGLPAGFRQVHPAARPLADAEGCSEAPAGCPASYRYRISLHRRRCRSLWVECWRRYPAPIGWQRRCGPMPLERFLARFRSGAAASFSS